MKLIWRKQSFHIITGLCMLMAFLLIHTPNVKASDTGVDSLQHIYDDANLLSSSENTELEQMCKDSGDEVGIKIMILTHNDPNAVDNETYVEDFYNKMYLGDSVILLVNMYNHDVFIAGYGLAETYIHSKRISIIVNEITPYLSDGKYDKAFESYINSSVKYMKDDSELNEDHNYNNSENPTNNSGSNKSDDYYTSINQYNSSSSTNNQVENTLTNIWVQLLAAFVIGGIAVGIMVFNSGGRMTTGAGTYLDESQSGLIGKRDVYLRTSITKVKKPTTNNTTGTGGFNAGGFSGGSSGGNSHSSGGGKF